MEYLILSIENSYVDIGRGNLKENFYLDQIHIVFQIGLLVVFNVDSRLRKIHVGNHTELLCTL